MSTVSDEKGLNAQTGGAGEQVQERVTKEESEIAPNLEICAPLYKFLMSSFGNLIRLTHIILLSFGAANMSGLGMKNTYKERKASLRIAKHLGEIEELRELLEDLYVEGYNREFFEDQNNMKKLAAIVRKLTALYNDFTAGKITDFDDLAFDFYMIEFYLKQLLIDATGVKTPTKEGNK